MSGKATMLRWQSWVDNETGHLILYYEDSMHGNDIWIEWRPDGAYLREWADTDDDFVYDDDTPPIYTRIDDLRSYMAEAIGRY